MTGRTLFGADVLRGVCAQLQHGFRRFFAGDVWHSFRSSPVAMMAAVIAFICIFCALFAEVIARFAPTRMETKEVARGQLGN